MARPGSPGFAQEMTFACARYETADEAVQDYLRAIGARRPDVICLAAAGPVVHGRVHLTNNHWTLDERELRESSGADKVLLLNDFEAVAYSVPHLGPDDYLQIGPPPARQLTTSDFTVGIVGPGTGLGGAGLLQRDGRQVPVVGEAGHTGFAPETPLQLKLLEELRQDFERVSDERLVSGQGLENLYRVLSRLQGAADSSASASEIARRAAAGEDARAEEALQLFFEVLGQVAGNLALVLGAADGVYIAGGIVKRYPELFAASRFREGFERKGRHRALLERIPTLLIRHPEPGLLGAASRCISLL